jgi:hypothetical protein
MNTKLKIIVVILFVLLGYNIYEYYISIEGWSDSAEADAPYDISVTPGVAVSLSGLDSSKTYTHTIDSFTRSADASSVITATNATDAQAAWALTNLIVGADGSITGTTNSGVNIDGVFGFQFIEGDITTHKYLKIKIIPGNTDSIGILTQSSTRYTAPTYDASNPSANACGNIDEEPNACDMPEGNAQSACVAIEAEKDRMKTALARVTAQANVKLAEIEANKPDSYNNIISSVGSAGTEIIGGIAQLTPWGALSTAITEAGSTAREVFSSDQSAEQAMNNIFRTTINSQNTSTINLTCQSETSTMMANLISIEACTPDTMGITPEIFSTLAQAGKIGPFVTGVDQSINFSSNMECKMAAMTENIMEGKTDSEKQAIQSSMADMQGSGHISTNQAGCNEQTTTKNSCTYISEKQCCSDVKRDVMSNSLNVASCFADIDNINQKVTYNSAASCGQIASADAFTASDDSDTQTTTQATENEQSSIWVPIAIVGGVVFVLSVGIYFYIKSDRGRGNTNLKQNTSAPVSPPPEP